MEEKLCEAIKDTALEVHGVNLNIALVWLPIKDGTPWRPQKQTTCAIHVECPKDKHCETQTIIAKIYGAGATAYPLGIKLRYALMVLKDTTSYTKSKILALNLKQDWFLNNIEDATS